MKLKHYNNLYLVLLNKIETLWKVIALKVVLVDF